MKKEQKKKIAQDLLAKAEEAFSDRSQEPMEKVCLKIPKYKKILAVHAHNVKEEIETRRISSDEDLFTLFVEKNLIAVNNKIVERERHWNATKGLSTANFDEYMELECWKITAKHLLAERNTKPTPTRKAKPKVSYEWLGNMDEVEALFYKLVEGGYLNRESCKDNFIKVFSKKPISDIKPITWKGQTNLLAFLIDLIYEKRKIPSDTELWKVAKNCFVNAALLKQLRNTYLSNKVGKPKGYLEIKTIIDSL